MSEMAACSERERKRRMSILEDDVRSGKIRRDILVNSAFEFRGETRAMYYSNARKNLQTYTAELVMKSNQQLNDLKSLKHLRRNETL